MDSSKDEINVIAFRIMMKTLKLFFQVSFFFALVLTLGGLWILSKIPTDKKIRGCMTTEMYQVQLCPGSSQYIPLSRISPFLQKAVVLSEDSSFWQHNGFDLQEMQNSLKTNLEKGRFARGGSTISQQLAKNLFLSKEKTIYRKVIEAIITVRLEEALSKKEILERYLNVVQFGKDIFGIKNAAQFYFKKTPSELNLAESAFLAFLLPGPEVYSKSFYKKQLTPFASRRIHEIIERLYRYKSISENDYQNGKSQVDYFLTGQEPPPLVDPSVLEIPEENFETEDY